MGDILVPGELNSFHTTATCTCVCVCLCDHMCRERYGCVSVPTETIFLHMLFLVCLFVLFVLLAPLPVKADCPDPVQSEWGKKKIQ